MFLDALEDAAYVELHAAYEGHLKNEGTHEIVEHFIALPLQLHSLVIFQIPQEFVVGHGQLHHAIYLSL